MMDIYERTGGKVTSKSNSRDLLRFQHAECRAVLPVSIISSPTTCRQKLLLTDPGIRQINLNEIKKEKHTLGSLKCSCLQRCITPLCLAVEALAKAIQ